MALFILGLIAGGVAVWYWTRPRAGTGAFENYLSRELETRERLEQLKFLEARLEILERELTLAQPAKSAFLPAHPLQAAASTAKPPRENGAAPEYRRPASARTGQAFALLEKGCNREEILCQTRLGQGAVDLIFSLHENKLRRCER